jgi:hypothetical protein
LFIDKNKLIEGFASIMTKYPAVIPLSISRNRDRIHKTKDATIILTGSLQRCKFKIESKNDVQISTSFLLIYKGFYGL